MPAGTGQASRTAARKRPESGRKAADEAWSAFRRAYFAELDAGGPDIAAALDQLRAVKGRVTLLYGARDEERNNATALLEWLKRDVKNGA